MSTKNKKRRPLHESLVELDATVAVLCGELRRRAVLPIHDGGLTNQELVGATKALEGIRVEALSLLEDDVAEGDED